MRPAAATALLGIGLLLVAATFDAEPLYVPGVAFVLLAGACAGWVAQGARGVRVERRVGARRVVEEQPVRIDIHVTAGRVPLPSGLIDDPLLREPAVMAAGRRRTHVRIDARFVRRGRRALAAPRVIVRDPFGLATRVVAGEAAADLLVLPRVEPVVAGPGGGDGSGPAVRRGRPVIAAEVDLDGLRPHREGAPASRIFWPALARGGGLMERRLRADGDIRPLVVVDPRAPAREEDLDAAVRAAASLCVHLARTGGCAVLLPGDRRPSAIEETLSGWAQMHVRLALLGAERGPNVAGLAARRGPVLYVAARAGARPPQALLHAPGAQRVLVVPGALEGRRPAFTVGGCAGYELGVRHARRRAA
ncbi:MAG: hypothetical protein ACXVSX_13335 [Solirubrobacteraceae bacterium]